MGFSLNHPASLGYPHNYGNPHISLKTLIMNQINDGKSYQNTLKWMIWRYPHNYGNPHISLKSPIFFWSPAPCWNLPERHGSRSDLCVYGASLWTAKGRWWDGRFNQGKKNMTSASDMVTLSKNIGIWSKIGDSTKDIQRPGCSSTNSW